MTNSEPGVDQLDLAEREVARMLRPFAELELPDASADRIRSRLLDSLATPVEVPARRARKLIVGFGVIAPLLVVTAVGAASGDEAPLPNFVDSAVSVIGIGGNSGGVRQDADNRAQQSGDNGQAGSTPGRSGDAPGLTGQAPKPEASPFASPAADGTPSPGVAAAAPEATRTPPHENGKGCDDVLFANGEPPFASPGGPVGCDVGNSGDHRKNGANAAETPAPEGTAGTPTADTGDDDSGPGGVSHGLGIGHSDDKPGNGQAVGHDVHEHEPNENGNGPGGPDSGATAGAETPPAQPSADAAPKPGNQGKGNGAANGKGPGKNN